MRNEPLTEMISVVFSPRQVKAIELEARREGRKVGNFIRHVVVNHLTLVGALEEESEPVGIPDEDSSVSEDE